MRRRWLSYISLYTEVIICIDKFQLCLYSARYRETALFFISLIQRHFIFYVFIHPTLPPSVLSEPQSHWTPISPMECDPVVEGKGAQAPALSSWPQNWVRGGHVSQAGTVRHGKPLFPIPSQLQGWPAATRNPRGRQRRKQRQQGDPWVQPTISRVWVL